MRAADTPLGTTIMSTMRIEPTAWFGQAFLVMPSKTSSKDLPPFGFLLGALNLHIRKNKNWPDLFRSV
jgi:hypothetical protein